MPQYQIVSRVTKECWILDVPREFTLCGLSSEKQSYNAVQEKKAVNLL